MKKKSILILLKGIKHWIETNFTSKQDNADNIYLINHHYPSEDYINVSTHSSSDTLHIPLASALDTKVDNPPGKAGYFLRKTPSGVEWQEIKGGATTWGAILDKPFDSIGDNLKVINNQLDVDVISEVEKDNTKPITSAAVYTEVGNINALLEQI